MLALPFLEWPNGVLTDEGDYYKKRNPSDQLSAPKDLKIQADLLPDSNFPLNFSVGERRHDGT